jgi:hypothetical protein
LTSARHLSDQDRFVSRITPLHASQRRPAPLVISDHNWRGKILKNRGFCLKLRVFRDAALVAAQ